MDLRLRNAEAFVELFVGLMAYCPSHSLTHSLPNLSLPSQYLLSLTVDLRLRNTNNYLVLAPSPPIRFLVFIAGWGEIIPGWGDIAPRARNLFSLSHSLCLSSLSPLPHRGSSVEERRSVHPRQRTQHRIWHMQDSQGQIPASAFRQIPLKPFKLFSFRPSEWRGGPWFFG